MRQIEFQIQHLPRAGGDADRLQPALRRLLVGQESLQHFPADLDHHDHFLWHDDAHHRRADRSGRRLGDGAGGHFRRRQLQGHRLADRRYAGRNRRRHRLQSHQRTHRHALQNAALHRHAGDDDLGARRRPVLHQRAEYLSAQRVHRLRARRHPGRAHAGHFHALHGAVDLVRAQLHPFWPASLRHRRQRGSRPRLGNPGECHQDVGLRHQRRLRRTLRRALHVPRQRRFAERRNRL